MIDNVDGIISAAPMPMLARAAISTLTEPEKAAHAEPPAKATRPARNVRLRPTRSARLPATSSSPRENKRVGIDDPLQLARGGVQIPHQRGQRDVEDGVVQIDDQQ